MIASSWEFVVEQILTKFCKKLWPNICKTLENHNASVGEENVSDEPQKSGTKPLIFLEVFMQIDGFFDLDDIYSWLDVDSYEGYTTMTKKEICASYSSNMVIQ